MTSAAAPGARGAVLGWRCAVCATTVDVAAPHAFECPRRTADDPYHVLHPIVGGSVAIAHDADGHRNPFVRYGPRQAWWEFARTHGMTEPARIALAADVADGFADTPLRAHDLRLADGEEPLTVWVKDETGNVGGSHKARHLVGILLHLRAAELLGIAPYEERPPLAIASCGNAAIAAATLARRVDWPLRVFVPTWASTSVLSLLEELGAGVTTCPRLDSDPPGDPAVLRFREAVAAGAIPFSVQGPENALCLDGGRTIGWELADAAAGPDGPGALDRALVQVGGGALATCLGWGLGAGVRLDTVQADGCAPLARAWWRARDAALQPAQVPGRWAVLMTPWTEPHSSADGILDDETYDWLGAFDVMARSGGEPLVAPEEAVVAAHAAARTTGIPVSPTGSAGLAGLLVVQGRPQPGERVAVVFSGIER